MLGPLEDMLADPALPAADTERLTMMHRNALRLLKLVNTVLDFSRLESGRLAARYQPTDLAGYTARLASTFRSATERAGLRLVVDCPPLPAPVFVDRDMWEKIVLNLVSNAVKFTFDGEIRVRVRAVDGAARLDVTDSGIGIVPEELPHVFERFHRVPGARARTHEGTGIGLALVRELVEMHGGEVGLTSEVDRGSTFTVTVPFGSAHLPADQVAAFRPLPAGEPEQARLYRGGDRAVDRRRAGSRVRQPTDGGRPAGRILVVDDNVDLREHVTRLLSPTWEVVTASDGLAGLQLAREGGFDLVLTDVMMPRLDGFGLVSALRADPRTRHVPIVLLSARAGSAEAVAGLSVGADDYLTKPFTGQELIARVRANVELGQLRGQIIRRLRALADAAVEVNTARSTGDVLQVAAGHALSLAEAARVVVTATGARGEADTGGATATDPSFVADADRHHRQAARRAAGLVAGRGRHAGRRGRVDPAGPPGRGAAGERPALRGRAPHRQHAAAQPAAPVAASAAGSGRGQPLPARQRRRRGRRRLVRRDRRSETTNWCWSSATWWARVSRPPRRWVNSATRCGRTCWRGTTRGESLTRLNRLVGSTERRSFATVVCLLFDPRTGRLRYASAGHPSPLLITGGDVTFLHDRALGPPIGALAGATYDAVEGELLPAAGCCSTPTG